MRLEELNAEQKKELKQDVLNNRLGNPSYGELANAEELVTDEELEAAYGGTEFTEDDFAA